MKYTIVDILRLGFTGLAFYYLYWAFRLSREVITTPKSEATPGLLAEKRRTVLQYSLTCVVVLIISVGAELYKFNAEKQPVMSAWIYASAVGQFSPDELKQRPLELSTWKADDPSNSFKSFVLTGQPKKVEVPSSGGMVMISIPQVSQIPQ